MTTRTRAAVDWRSLVADGARINASDLNGSLLVAKLDATRDVVVLMVPVAHGRTEAVKGIVRHCLSLVESWRFFGRVGGG